MVLYTWFKSREVSLSTATAMAALSMHKIKQITDTCVLISQPQVQLQVNVQMEF